MTHPATDDLLTSVPEWMIKAFPHTLAVTGWGVPGDDESEYPDRMLNLRYEEMP